MPTVEAALQGARDVIAERDQRRRRRPRPHPPAVLDAGHPALRSPRRQGGRRAPSTRTTSTGPSQSPTRPRTACWPSAAAKPRRFCRARSGRPKQDALAILDGAVRQRARSVRRAGAPGGAGRLQAPARRGRWRRRRAPRPSAAPTPRRSACSRSNLRQLLLARAARPEARAGDRPRLAHRLQDRRARRRGSARPRRGDLPRPGPAAHPRGERTPSGAWSRRYQIEAIAIGNGTAGRETEAFVRALGLPAAVAVVMVNESGASVYSASDVAREEFPDHDITVRGAVSIGRRLMDPLAELVKLDAKSIGVGQYQHDVDQDELKRSLDDVVVSCVNAVGVEVNTASKQLLAYVSGLNATRRRQHRAATATRAVRSSAAAT